MSLDDAVRDMAEARHGDAALFYAKEILSIIEAHHQILRISNDPKYPAEVQAQRKAIMSIPAKILRQEAIKMFNDYFIPEFKKWVEASS